MKAPCSTPYWPAALPAPTAGYVPARIRERVFQIARARYRTTDEEVGTFYWPEHLDPVAEPPFREPADEDSVRAADEISLTELASLARTVIAQGSQGEGIYQAMARRLGLQQLRAASRARLENALRSLPSNLES